MYESLSKIIFYINGDCMHYFCFVKITDDLL
jgi:hypothetical protein